MKQAERAPYLVCHLPQPNYIGKRGVGVDSCDLVLQVSARLNEADPRIPGSCIWVCRVIAALLVERAVQTTVPEMATTIKGPSFDTAVKRRPRLLGGSYRCDQQTD